MICHDLKHWPSLSIKWGNSRKEWTGFSWTDPSRVQQKLVAGLQGHLLGLCLPKQILPAEVLGRDSGLEQSEQGPVWHRLYLGEPLPSLK